MKHIFLIAIIFVTLLSIVSVRLAYAQNSSEPTVEQVIQQILSKQNVTGVSQLDCSKISKDDFVELGNALMERMIGNHQLHEQMHDMMGGENSSVVIQMHMVMGQNWLGCNGNSQGMMNNMMGMMPMMMAMAGNYYPNYFTAYNTLLTFTIIGWLISVVLVVIIVLVYIGKIKIRRKKR